MILPQRKTRLPILGVLLGSLIVLLALSWTQSLTDGNEERLSVPGASDAELGLADRNPLGDMQGLTVAQLAVEGTVVEIRGPKVEVDEEFDTVAYDRGEDGVFPSVVVKIDHLVMDFERTQPFTDLMASTFKAARSGSTIEMMHSDGKLEVGRKYTFFVGPWEPDLPNIFYAVDMQTDRPAPGLGRESYERVTRLLLEEVGRSRGESFENDTEMLVDFANSYDQATLASTDSFAGDVLDKVSGEVASDVDQRSSGGLLYYPQTGDARAELPNGQRYVPIELLISGAAPGALYGLEGNGGLLVWFVADENGLVIMSGSVPSQGAYTVVQGEIERVTDDGTPLEGSTIAIDDSDFRGEVILDQGKVVTVTKFDDQATLEFEAAIERATGKARR